MIESWWKRALSSFRSTTNSGVSRRISGLPTSSNGASSFHLNWQLPSTSTPRVIAAEVTLEISELPTVDRLYFWALQANFVGANGQHSGGGHLGLQWHQGHPGSRAVNWGGYDYQGNILPGSVSALPSKMANPHTRDFLWRAAVPYRLRIEQVTSGGPSAWRGTVTEVSSGVTTVVRDLYSQGDLISGVTMWSEVFARCDDPSVVIRWSNAEVQLLDGTREQPTGFGVNYQSDRDGGCANTDSSSDGFGIVQRTAVQRLTQQGQVISR